MAIGGGTGLSTMLRGLKRHTNNLTAIVTVADDGGGSGVLRQELGMPPPGDIRNCLEALANVEPLMSELLHYRFTEGSLRGQSFGNLFLAALNGISGSFDQAVSRMSQVLAITGTVLPVTTANVQLEAEFENGARVLGESKIFYCKKREDCRIRRVRLLPERPPALAPAIAAIEEADMILLGPGSLYTSIIPNLLVDGIAEAILRSDALKIYIANVMTQEGETEGYSNSDHAVPPVPGELRHHPPGCAGQLRQGGGGAPALQQGRLRRAGGGAGEPPGFHRPGRPGAPRPGAAGGRPAGAPRPAQRPYRRPWPLPQRGVTDYLVYILFFEKKRIKRNFLRETLFRLWGKGERCMKCPLCGKEMETCYLESSSFLYLTRKLHPFAGPGLAPGRDKIARRYRHFCLYLSDLPPGEFSLLTCDTRNEVSRKVFFCPFSFSKEKGELLRMRGR